MQGNTAYRLSLYNTGGSKTINPDTMEPFGSDPANLLSPMHLAINATVKIISAVKEPESREFKEKYPTYRFFIGEIQQYAANGQHVYFF